MKIVYASTSPLEDFKIYKILPKMYEIGESSLWGIPFREWGEKEKIYDIRITNMTIYLILGIVMVIIIIRQNLPIKGIEKEKIKNNKWGKVITIIYNSIKEMNKEFIGERNNKYISLILYIFIIILINNIIGIIPYSFTPTSHFIITITMSIGIIIGITIIGIRKYKIKFIKIFIPSGLGEMKAIIPLIMVIEIISYLSRIISLSVRLSTNMISGHILLHLVSSLSNIWPTILFSTLSIILVFPFFILEIGVCIIQAYVFTLLTLSYLKDIYYLH